jgi:hypothetical protein
MDTVEHATTLGVLVPALVDVLADHTAAEGGAGAIDSLDVAGERVRGADGVVHRVAQKGQEVAHAEEAEVHHARALGVVDELVDPAGLEAALDVEVDVRGREHHPAVLRLSQCQVPVRGRDRHARIRLVLAHGQGGGGALQHRIGLHVLAAFGARADAHREDARRHGVVPLAALPTAWRSCDNSLQVDHV